MHLTFEIRQHFVDGCPEVWNQRNTNKSYILAATCKFKLCHYNMRIQMYLTFEILQNRVYAFVEVWIPISANKSLFLVATCKFQPCH